MISLRNSCTGHRPVHLYQKLKAAAAALILAAAPHRASAAQRRPPRRPWRPRRARASPISTRRAKTRRCGLSPSAGDAAQQLISLLSTASLDGLDPDRYPAVRHSGGGGDRADAASARTSQRAEQRCPKASSLMSGDSAAIPASGSAGSIRAAAGAAVAAGGAARRRLGAVAFRICPDDGLDASVLRRAAQRLGRP